MSVIKVIFCVFIGVVLIIIGAVLTTPTYIDEEGLTGNEPIIAVLSDKANAPIIVLAEEDDTGKARIAFAIDPEKSEQVDFEKCTLWIIITDPLAEFMWDATSDIHKRELSALSATFTSKETKESAGSDSFLCCSLTLPSGKNALSEINIQFDQKHQQKRVNGFFEPRLPILISPTGNSSVIPYINYDTIDYVDRTKPDVIYASMHIDNTPLYNADATMGFEFVEKSSFIGNELLRNTVSPSAVYDRPTIYWEGIGRLAPYIRYEDKVWNEKRDAKMIFGGVLIGLGGGLVTAPMGNALESKKKTDATSAGTRKRKKRK